MSDSSLSGSDREDAPVARSRAVTRRKTQPNKSQQALDQLRHTRALGLTRAQQYELEDKDDEKPLYDLVDEKEYKRRIHESNLKGGFVVEDDGTGYVDKEHSESEDDDLFKGPSHHTSNAYTSSNEVENDDDERIDSKKHKRHKKKDIKQFSGYGAPRHMDENTSSTGGDIGAMFGKIRRDVVQKRKQRDELEREKQVEKEMEAILESDLGLEIKRPLLPQSISSAENAFGVDYNARGPELILNQPSTEEKATYNDNQIKWGGETEEDCYANFEGTQSGDGKMTKADVELTFGENQVQKATQNEPNQENDIKNIRARLLTRMATKVKINLEEAENDLGESLSRIEVENKLKMESVGAHRKNENLSLPREESQGSSPIASPVATLSSANLEDILKPFCKACSEIFPGLEDCPNCSAQLLKENRAVRMFLIDLYEDKLHCPGAIFAFGKVELEVPNQFINICIKINNLEKSIYILPENENVEIMTMHKYIGDFMTTILKSKTSSSEKFRMKKVRRHFAFEHQTMPIMNAERSEREDIHFETEPRALREPKLPNGDYNMFKIKYLLKNQKSYMGPEDIESTKYGIRKVFNVNQGGMEGFIVSRKLKGPGWVYLTNVSAASQNWSWCQLALEMNSPKDFIVAPSTQKKCVDPLFTVLSLGIKTVVDAASHSSSIKIISCKVLKNQDLQAKLEDNRAVEDFIFMIDPEQFGDAKATDLNVRELLESAQQQGKKLFIQRDEKSLLSMFLTQFRRMDPDIIVSHGLLTFDLALLFHRFEKLKVPQWSRLQRLKVSLFPNNYVKAGVKHLPGIISVDTEVSSRELLLGQKTYSFEHLIRSHMHPQIQYKDFEVIEGKNIISEALSKGYSGFLRQLSDELQLAFKLCDYLGVLSLTRNVTNLCGNNWNRTLSAGRSERIEYLLLHELKRLKYIFPEKSKPIKGEATGGAQYAGGLVLEPKKGLYNKNLILLLDFNSLYPSIMREFNYCFSRGPDGILPRVIGRLVDRRSEIKKEISRLAGKPGMEQELEGYDIRQKALKIIANSMYGCLGFAGSRFYDQETAAMITAKGRELLQETVATVEQKFGLEVVYGDTDSLMVKTNVPNRIFNSDGELDNKIWSEVREISSGIRKEVSKRYKVLELGEDGIFASLLLLKKKKYAALALSVSKKSAEANSYSVKVKREVKGLDMVRRDWCPLVKHVSHKLVEILLGQAYFSNSGSLRAEAVNPGDDPSSGEYDAEEQVIDTITRLKGEIDGHAALLKDYVKGRSSIDIREVKRIVNKYCVTKGVNKELDKYDSTEVSKANTGLAHVMVAKRMQARGEQIKVGDHIPYLFVTTEGLRQDESQPIYAVHPNEFLDSILLASAINSPSATVILHTHHYCEQQILPPILRLLAEVEQLNKAQIYDILGVAHKEAVPSAFSGGYNLNYDKHQKFEGCKPVMIPCFTCSKLLTLRLGENAVCEDQTCKSLQPREYIDNLTLLQGRRRAREFYCNKQQIRTADSTGHNMDSVMLASNEVSVRGCSKAFDNLGGKLYNVDPIISRKELHTEQHYLYELAKQDTADSEVKPMIGTYLFKRNGFGVLNPQQLFKAVFVPSA